LKMRVFSQVTNETQLFTYTKTRQKKLREKHIIYYIGLVFINLSFSLAIFKVEKYQKISGMGAYMATQNTTAPLEYDDLIQYKDLLIYKNKETNPNNLIYGGFFVAQKKYFFASYKIFFILNELSKHGFASTTLEKKKYDFLVEKGLFFSRQNSLFEKDFLPIGFEPSVQYEHLEDYCAKPANLFMTLGFFEIAGNFYECAYLLNSQNDSYALKAFEAFHKIENEQGLSRILTLVKSGKVVENSSF
jgi:rhomboid protease GluP